MTHVEGWTVRFVAIVALLTGCFASGQTVATVPSLVKFSGTVPEPRSRIVGVTFALYKDEQGGSPLWMETQSVPLDTSGHYTVQLGSTFPAGLPKELFASGEARWLGVQPEGQSEQARALLVSVPYALKAADAETIGGLPPSAFVLKGQRTREGQATTKSAAKRVAGPSPMVMTNVTTSGGTPNMLPLFSSSTDIEDSVVAQLGNSIGINTPAPGATLDVNGTANVRGNLSSTGLVNSAAGYEIGGSLVTYTVGQGSTNWFFGQAGNTTTTGGDNLGAGYQALLSNAGGLWNTAVGAYTLTSNRGGNLNTAVGQQALGANDSGSDNTAVGVRALDINSAGNANTAVGEGSMQANTGSNNTAVGYYSVDRNQGGSYNTGVGFSSLHNNTTGSYNSTLGYLAGPDSGTTGLNNATAIGAFADVKSSNALVLGSIYGVNFATADTSVGIGITTPAAKLHIGSPSNGAATTSLRIEGPSRSGISAHAVSLGGWGDFGIDAYGAPDARFVVRENGRVGIGTPFPDNLLSVNGSADKVGGGSWGTFSDRRLKDLKGGYTSGLAEVLRINPVRYRYKDQNEMGINDRQEHVGLVAQEIQKVIPEAVSENSKGYLLVNNDPIIWAMLNAIKEQQQQIRKQRAQFHAQQTAISNLKSQLRETQQVLTKVKAKLESAQPSLVATK